jgi:TrpR-related protein YerC/YecD
MTNEDIWKRDTPKRLAVALASISAISDMQNLLRDLMTEKEIMEMSARFEAASMLKSGKKYTDITKATKLSSRTIARISEWLKNGEGGYEKTINTVEAHHLHISPGRD